jgi:hypothetical protein
MTSAGKLILKKNLANLVQELTFKIHQKKGRLQFYDIDKMWTNHSKHILRLQHIIHEVTRDWLFSEICDAYHCAERNGRGDGDAPNGEFIFQ